MPPKPKKGSDPKGEESKGPKDNPQKDAQKGDQNKGGGGEKKDTINQDDIEEEYGLSYALFKAFPELDDLLKKAIANSYTAQRFQVELRQTKWFQKHSDIWRENTALFYSDPATFEERLGTVTTKLGDLAASVGARLTPNTLSRLAKRALLTGMSDEELRDVLSRHVKPSAQGYTGDLASIEQSLRSTAYANGVRIQDDQIQKWMKAIVRGEANEDQFRTNIRNMAAAAFPLYGEQVKAGVDLIDVATPYMNSMSEILELAPGSFDLTDPLVRKALSGNRDAKGNAAPMNTSEFEDMLRQDKRWGYTRQANDSAKSMASAIAQMWGVA
jgi:hypothetical protein